MCFFLKVLKVLKVVKEAFLFYPSVPYTARMKMSFMLGMISVNERSSTASFIAATVLRTSASSPMWILSVGLGWLLGIFFGMGLTGIWIAMAADEIFRGVVVLIRWIKGSWRGKRVVLEEKTNSNGTAKATA